MKSGGCAVISSTTAVTHHTRTPLQAALAHLESIIHDPFDPQAAAQVNGGLDEAEEVLSEQDEVKE